MSDHKRCKACGRIEETTLRQEHEARMQARIERFRTETHAERSERLVGGRCSAHTMGYGGRCLSCGWQS